MPKTYRITELEIVIENLIAAAVPILRAFNDSKKPKDYEIIALDNATDNGREVLK